MKTTIQTSRGPVRFHSVGEPIVGIPADTDDILTDSLADASYWKGEARKAQAAKADLLCMLERVLDGVLRLPEIPRTLCSLEIEQARKAIAKAKGGA